MTIDVVPTQDAVLVQESGASFSVLLEQIKENEALYNVLNKTFEQSEKLKSRHFSQESQALFTFVFQCAEAYKIKTEAEKRIESLQDETKVRVVFFQGSEEEMKIFIFKDDEGQALPEQSGYIVDNSQYGQHRLYYKSNNMITFISDNNEIIEKPIRNTRGKQISIENSSVSKWQDEHVIAINKQYHDIIQEAFDTVKPVVRDFRGSQWWQNLCNFLRTIGVKTASRKEIEKTYQVLNQETTQLFSKQSIQTTSPPEMARTLSRNSLN